MLFHPALQIDAQPSEHVKRIRYSCSSLMPTLLGLDAAPPTKQGRTQFQPRRRSSPKACVVVRSKPPDVGESFFQRRQGHGRPAEGAGCAPAGLLSTG